jgi:hypothetical protein
VSEQSEQPAEQEEPEVEWIPVVRWPEGARAAVTDIEKILHVLDLMTGAADDMACQVFTDFLQTVLLHRRQELAMIMLDRHGVALPEPGSVQTPQQRMSAGLAHIADEVRKRRPDLVPEHQPPTERARRRLPDMEA